MRKTVLASLAVSAAILLGAAAQAQAPAGPPMYGTPGINLEQAQKAIAAAAAEAKKNNWYTPFTSQPENPLD